MAYQKYFQLGLSLFLFSHQALAVPGGFGEKKETSQDQKGTRVSNESYFEHYEYRDPSTHMPDYAQPGATPHPRANQRDYYRTENSSEAFFSNVVNANNGEFANPGQAEFETTPIAQVKPPVHQGVPTYSLGLSYNSQSNSGFTGGSAESLLSNTTIGLPNTGGGYAPMIGASGVASVVSQGLMVATQGMPRPDYSQFEKRVEAIRQNTQRIRKENESIQREIDKGNSAEAKRWSQNLKEQINQNQIRLNTPVSNLLSNAANEMIQKKSNASQTMLERELRGYDSVDLEHEISTWKTYSKEKKDTLDQIAQFAAQATRLEKLRTLDRPYENVVRAAIQSGLDVLNEAAQIAGGRKNGIFRDTLELSQSIYEIGKAVTDFGLSTVPGISTARDIYEAATGYNLVSGEELSTFDRALSLVNIATLGIGKTPLKGIQRIGQWIHSGGEGERVLKESVHAAREILDSARKHGIKIVTGTNATKVDKVILESLKGTGNLTSKFKLSAEEALDAGKKWVGPGYTERKAGSGVFVSADGQRQFRIDNNSILGNHSPDVPHVHLEMLAPGQKQPIANNHIPFHD